MASGVVDGAHWGAAQGALSMSLWEVAKFHMKPTMGLAMDTLIMNQKAIDALPDDLRTAFFNLLEVRFWKRTTEYQYKEQLALAKGTGEMKVKVARFPDDVLAKFSEASGTILKEEAAKGGNAAKGVEMLNEFMKNLGYV
ncbi:MAG: hypothetical protein R3E83_21820 [Burkholderiaceae bacterium]